MYRLLQLLAFVVHAHPRGFCDLIAYIQFFFYFIGSVIVNRLYQQLKQSLKPNAD